MLRDLKVDKCPVCGCSEVVEESIHVDRLFKGPEIRIHVNGQRWEERRFLCGYAVEHIPNFYSDKKVSYSDCFYDPEVVKRRELDRKTSILKKSFLEAMATGGFTDEWMQAAEKLIAEKNKSAD